MDFAWLKQTMPKGLYGRAALILLLPIVVLQVVVAVVFVQRHFADVTRQMTAALLLDLRYVLEQVEAQPEAAQAVALQNALKIRVDTAQPGRTGFRRFFYDVSGQTVIRELRGGLDGLKSVDLTRSTREVHLWLETAQGVRHVVFDRRRVSAATPHQLLVLMALIGLVMTGVAFVYLRNQLRPITRLAAAAEAFGRGRLEPYKPSGALEVRAAGSAFLDMRARIERQTASRTLMLSGVSHDLRTPLTRLRLGLSMVEPGPETQAMEQDLSDMERMLDGFLDFARSDAMEEAEMVDPVALAREAVEKARRGLAAEGARGAGKTVTLAPVQAEGEVPMIALRRLAVERALGNLIANALRYGQTALVSVTLGERMVRYTVEDNGPGIPEARREEALRPFARLDAARNQDMGPGVGLGLAITLDIARSHGGALRLGASEALGGLKAELVLAR